MSFSHRSALGALVCLALVSCSGGASPTEPVKPTTPSGPTAISLNASVDTVRLDTWGDTSRVSVSVLDEKGSAVSGATLAWTSLDSTVVTVSSSGALTSVRKGGAKVRVTATYKSLTPAQRDFTVTVGQRNAKCVAPTATQPGSPGGVPAFSTNVELLSSPTPAWPGARTVALDYDGDGDTDAIRLEYSTPGTQPYSGEVRVFRNEGGNLVDASAAVLSAKIIPDSPRDVEVRDFTGDGVPDLYVAQHGFDASPFPGAPNLFLTRDGSNLVNRAATAFSPYSTRGFSHGSAAGDVDCDGDVDIVELNLSSAEPDHLFLNGGAGSFTSADGNLGFGSGGGQRWQEAELFDFDLDGDLDLFLGARSGSGWNQDELRVNDGFGHFRKAAGIVLPPPSYQPNHAVNSVKAADFNRDGRPDLVLFEIPQPFSTTSAIRLLLNAGDGSFKDAGSAWNLPARCTGEVVEPLDVVDVNRDGWPDFSVPQGCAEIGGPGVFVNQGTSFTYFAFSRIQPWLNSVGTFMDLDGDGDLDIFFANRGGNNVIVRNPG